jgi:hypothetical protein
VKKSSLIAVGLFLLGCATGGVASHVITPVQAQSDGPDSGRARWEYQCVSEHKPDKFQARANALGKGGWELAAAAMTGATSFDGPVWCFKRRS